MAKQLNLKEAKGLKEVRVTLPPRLKLSPEESLKRTLEFDQRKEQFIAALRKSQN